jgi:predicted DNA-binding protein YlxM (UPF0122 family)
MSTMVDKDFSILGLTKKEGKVVRTLSVGDYSPTTISEKTKISRQGVYKILYNLQRRGLITQNKDGKKKVWTLCSKDTLFSVFNKTISSFHHNKHEEGEVRFVTAGQITMYTGKKGMETVFKEIIKEYKNQEFFTLQTKKGDMALLDLFPPKEIAKYAKLVSGTSMIHRNIYEKGMVENAFRVYGLAWARSYVNRTASVSELDKKFSDFSSQVWLSSKTLYIVAIEEKVALVIKNKNLIKMLHVLLSIAHNSSHKIDVNSLVRSLMKP